MQCIKCGDSALCNEPHMWCVCVCVCQGWGNTCGRRFVVCKVDKGVSF